MLFLPVTAYFQTFIVVRKAVRTLAAQKKMYSIFYHLAIDKIYLSVTFSIILYVFL